MPVVLKEFILWWDKVKWGVGQLYDRSTVYKKEVFTTFDWLKATLLKYHAYTECMTHLVDVCLKLQHSFRNVSRLCQLAPCYVINKLTTALPFSLILWPAIIYLKTSLAFVFCHKHGMSLNNWWNTFLEDNLFLNQGNFLFNYH